jgi:hypothetical protein
MGADDVLAPAHFHHELMALPWDGKELDRLLEGFGESGHYRGIRMDAKKKKIVGEIKDPALGFVFEVWGVGKPIGAARMRQIYRAWKTLNPGAAKCGVRVRVGEAYAQALASGKVSPRSRKKA